MKKVRYLVYGLFGGFVVLCPLVFDCFSALCRFRAAFVCLYALGFIFLLKALLVPGRRLRIALPDVLLALYLSWGACNLLFVKAGGTDALPIFEWISLLLGYLLARSVPERAVPLVLGAIVCSGCVQAAAGFLQWLDVLPSNHNLFPVTGSFMNPGPYGGYLAVCWVVGAGLAIRAVRRRRWPSAAGWAVAVLVVGCLLVLSDSRAAWLAVLLALAWLLCRAAGIRWTGIPVGLKIAAAVVFAVVLCALYGYKKGSADARLLIWRVSCRMFVESPVTGSGIASYASRYMDAQSEYFAENPQSPFLDVAGNNHRAFNEFIRVGCEQGAVGLLLAGGFLLSLFGKSRAGRFRDPIRGGILALLVFSFFSYTSDIYPLKFYYALLPGLLRLRPLRTATVPAVGRGVAVALVLAVAGMAVRFQGRYERASDRLQDYMRSPSEESLNRVKDCLPDVIYHPGFMWEYCRHLYLNRRYCDCLGVFPVYHAHVRKTSETLCDLGNAYLNVYGFREAEACFAQARQMIPTRIYPRYCLFRLYRSQGDTLRARQTAEALVAFPVRIMNSTSIRIKAEARNYLKHLRRNDW